MEGEGIVSDLSFIVGVDVTYITFGVACPCVSSLIGCVVVTEGVLDGLLLGSLSSHRAAGVYMFPSLVSMGVGVAVLSRFDWPSSSGGSSRASLKHESWVPESSKSPSSTSV